MKKKEYQKRIAKEKKEMKEYNELNHGINLKTFIIITISVILFIFIMFTWTKIKTGEWNLWTKPNAFKYTAEAQSTKILCGSILNRDDSEYLVLAYDMQKDNAALYETIIERYNNSSNKISLYKVDLGNSKNNICKSDSLNITDNISDLKLVEPTLVKVKDGNIIENYTDYNSIKNYLLSYIN